MASLLVLYSLISIALSAVCTGTTAVAPTSSCPLTSLANCGHKYQLFSGQIYQCWNNRGLCSRQMGPCTPICNGTISIGSCASAPGSSCLNYYQTDATGSYYCHHNPSTGACEVLSPKLYCATGYSVVCTGTGYTSNGCSTATTQTDCNNRWEGPNIGQKNQCQWDTIYNFCYVGVPCHP